jgi:hypothetical protein
LGPGDRSASCARHPALEDSSLVAEGGSGSDDDTWRDEGEAREEKKKRGRRRERGGGRVLSANGLAQEDWMRESLGRRMEGVEDRGQRGEREREERTGSTVVGVEKSGDGFVALGS